MIKIPRLAKDTILVLLSNGINLVTAGLWGILLARWLGKEYFGIYGYWLGLFSIIATICQFGLPGFLSRELANPDEKQKKLTFAFYFNSQVIGNLIPVVFFFIYIPLVESTAEQINLAVSTLLIVFSESLTTTVSSWFYGKEKAPFVAIIAVVRSVLVLLTGLGVYYTRTGVHFLLYVPAAYSVIRLLVFLALIVKDGNFTLKELVSFRFSAADLKRFFIFTWSFGLLSILGSFNLNSDPLILKNLGFSDSEYGIINAANRLRSIIGVTGGAILTVMLPKLAKDYFTSSEKFTSEFVKILKPLLVLNLALTISVTIFSEKLILLLYGEQYRLSVPYMFLFSIGSLSAVLTFLGASIVAIGKQRFNLFSSAVIYLLYPALKFLLIPKQGSIVIAWIEAIGPWISMLVFLLYINRFLRPRLSATFIIKIFLMVVPVMALTIVLAKTGTNPFVSLATTMLVIAGLSFKLKFVGKELFKKTQTY